jgi:hypothetical protein
MESYKRGVNSSDTTFTPRVRKNLLLVKKPQGDKTQRWKFRSGNIHIYYFTVSVNYASVMQCLCFIIYLSDSSH